MTRQQAITAVVAIALASRLAAATDYAEVIPPLRNTIFESPGSLNGDSSIAGGALTIQQAEASAVAVSPSLAAIDARVRAAKWECLQAGLRPNPTAGYVASEIGVEGAAGQQGVFFGQRFVRGGKLGYAQEVALREANRLQQEFAVERLRLLTDTRTAFYDAYLSQLEAELAGDLATLSGKAVDTAAQLLEAGEGRRTDLLQAQIEQQRAAATRRGAQQRRLAAWRRLAALTGLSGQSPQILAASRDDLVEELDWAPTLQELLATSPLIAERAAAIDKAASAVAYERSLAVQDVTAQVMIQYDDAADDAIAGVQVGMPLPIWNRNQGGIGRAQEELTASRRRLDATELAIRRRFAEVLGRFQAAHTQADALRGEVLPRAQESLDLATQGYEAGEIGFLDLLTVQRTYFQVSLELLSAYRELNTSLQLIRGGLLEQSGEPTAGG